MVKKIILVFKTHFDIGFTDLSKRVIDKYADSMLKEVIATCKATQHMGNLKYIWTMPSWPLKVITERCSADLKEDLDLLIERGQIVWHALPFTSHTDFCSAEEFIEGLRFGRELSDTYHKPYPLSAKMTDVPGHGIMLPSILAGAGIKFLHLGCNEFANPPKVPFLFFWQAVSGEKLLTMYSKGGYGTPLLPPEDWDYPVWMALMQTNDNCGPQSVSVIENLVKKVQKKYPEAEIVCGTMDDFYKELSQCDLSEVPIVTKDLADTWIHGIGAYPKEIGIVREDREASKRLQAILTKKVLEDSGLNESRINQIVDNYFENISLFGEHTWGADVKTWLGPDRVYSKKDFLKAKNLDNYKFMEASWEEQRNRAKQCSSAIAELKELSEEKAGQTVSLFNPGNGEFTGWVTLKGMNKDLAKSSPWIHGEKLPVTKIDGEWACFVKNLPALKTVPLNIKDSEAYTGTLNIKKEDNQVSVENHRYCLKFDGSEGIITELFDKQTGEALLKQQNRKGIFSYRYDRYGIEEVTAYLRDYAYRFSTWGIQDYGREAYPECEHKTYSPTFLSYSLEGDTVIFEYENSESVVKYGDAQRIRTEITLPPAGDEIFINLKLFQKMETPFIESGSFLIPLTGEAHQFSINKSNSVLNPATDIEEDANHVFYCLENYIAARGEKNGICVVAKDTPLASLGSTGIYQYMNNYKDPEEQVIYFNLFNNMWGTNFPQWIGGDLCYRFVLFGFNKEQEAANLERTAMIREGVELTHNKLEKNLCSFPEHMQLINARSEQGRMILRFKDLSGENSVRILKVNEYLITPVNLRNAVIGASSREEYEFQVKPYGIYSFLLSKSS